LDFSHSELHGTIPFSLGTVFLLFLFLLREVIIFY
jgi:hypothetical protein